MPAEILSVGTELLLGQITDTNATWLSERFAEQGIDVLHRATIGDNQPRIVAAIRQAVERADIVMITGGLGPTSDDLTKEAIAEALGVGVYRDEPSERAIREMFAARGIPMVEMNLKQADIPLGAHAIPNACGTAPGIYAESGRTLIFSVPGVPREMVAMVEHFVLPELVRRGRAGNWVIRSRCLKLVGIGESAAAARVQDLLDGCLNPTIAPLAGAGEVRLRITAKAATREDAELRNSELERVVRERFGTLIYGADEETLESAVVTLLVGRGLTLATAESCTGGLLGSRLTDVSGSSRCYLGGVVSYDNMAKVRLLGVPEGLLAQYGAVSEPVARAMAEGARSALGADLAIAVTGIAGPTGGSREKPVGLVYIAVASEAGVVVEEHRFGADRSTNKLRASQAALDLVRRTALALTPP